MLKKPLIRGISVVIFMLMAAMESVSYAGTFTAFGPKTFIRGSGKPVVETASFNIKNPGTSYTLHIYNGGTNSEYQKVSSAIIKLNGTTVFEENDFNQQVSSLQKQVNVSKSNQLQVELRSAQGSGLTITIEGADNTPPAVAVSSPADNAYLNTPAITVTGTASDSISWVNAVTVTGIGTATSGESYSVSLQLSEGPNAITATATDAAGNTGNSSITITLDTIPPKITLDAVKTITNNPQLTLTGKVEDANPSSLSINGTPVHVVNNAFSATINLSEGNNAIAITATDKAGNSSKTETAILLDTTPPTVNITSPVNQGTFNTSSLTVTGTSKDASSGIGSVTVNGTNAEISGDAYSATVQLKEGENQITVTAADAAGNTGQSAITIYIDTTAPAISINSPENGSTVNTETATVTGTVDDNTATVTVNGISTTVSNNAFTAPKIALIEGNNTITATAADEAGNTSIAAITIIRLTRDTTAPVLRITSPSEEYTSEYQEIEVWGIADDDSATVTVNGATAKVFKRGAETYFTASGIRLMEGRNVITVKAVDGAGNTGTATVTVTYMVKNSAITIQYPLNGSTVNYQWLEIWGTLADNITNVMVNDIPARIAGNTFSAGITLGKGLNIITVSAYDMAGRMVTKAITVTYQYMDTSGPAISITSPSYGSTLAENTITVTGTIDDNSATVTVSGISATVSNNTFTASNITLMEGVNTISVTAVNPAGNTSSALIAVYLDTVAPAILSTTPSKNYIGLLLDSNLIVTFNEIVDAYSITATTFTLSSATGPVSGSVTHLGKSAIFTPSNMLSSNTVYTAAIKGGPDGVKDIAGNALIGDYVWVFKTEEKVVKISITEPQDGAIVNKETAIIKGKIKYQTSDVGIKVNGIVAEINGENWVAVIPLAVGPNTIEATATDSAGNTDKKTISINTQTTNQPVSITTNPKSGIAPLNATYSIDTSITNTIISYKIDFEGDGVTSLETTSTAGITHTYNTPGIYYPTVTVTDSQYNTYTGTTIVNVLSKEAMDTLLKGTWDGMKVALGSGDIINAVNYFGTSSKKKYENVFSILKEYMPAIVSNMNEIRMDHVSENTAEYRISRMEDVDGQSMELTYFIYFTKDENGLWKIESF